MIVQRHDAPRGFTAADNIFTGANTFSGITTFTGDVGIGTSNPQELLHVGAGTDTSDITATDLLVTRAGPSNLSVRDSTNGVEIFLFASSVGGVMGTVTNDPLNILTNNTSAIFIDASQNVNMPGALTASSLVINDIEHHGSEVVNHSLDYTLVLADAGKVQRQTGISKTFTIPANSSVPYPIGTLLEFQGNNTVSLALTTDVLRMAGTSNTGTRTIPVFGVVFARKYQATAWVCWGNNLT